VKQVIVNLTVEVTTEEVVMINKETKIGLGKIIVETQVTMTAKKKDPTEENVTHHQEENDRRSEEKDRHEEEARVFLTHRVRKKLHHRI
jgi:hypothetical protein